MTQHTDPDELAFAREYPHAYAAIGYAQRGWRVLPVHRINEHGRCTCLAGGQARCVSAGKHPMEPDWPDKATTEVSEIIDTWGPNRLANVGIATGRTSGIFVVDVDEGVRPDGTYKQGLESKLALEDQYGDFPQTYTVRTGGGGCQYYFAMPDGYSIKTIAKAFGDERPDIDIRGDGGMVVAPPSVSGRGPYRVEIQGEVADPPMWMVDLLLQRGIMEPLDLPVDPVDSSTGEDGPAVEPSEAPGWLASSIDTKLEEVRNAPEGEGNQTINRIAFMIGQYVPHGWISQDEAVERLVEAVNSWAHPHPQASYTIRRAVRQGMAEPYTAVADRTTGPGVTVSNDANAATWLRHEIGQGELSCLFRRDGVLVHTPRIGEAGYIMPPPDEAEQGVHPGPAQVRPVSTKHVKSLVEVRYNVVKGRNRTPCLFPWKAAESAVSAAEIGEGTPNLRELHGITHTPVLRPDGTVLDAPGYDEPTGLLYLPEDGLHVPPVPDQPTMEEVHDALKFILSAVDQFPFVDDRDRANWLAGMFTPLLRPLLPPPYPWFVISAPQPGSGKTLLAKMIGIVHGLTIRGMLPESADEQRKLFTSILATTTAPVVLFDNMRGVVRSSELEKLLTSATHSDRILNQSKEVALTNDRLWLGTGNNAKIGGDLARRTWPIVIDPHQPDPHLRTGFLIADLEAWMYEHRGEYLAALLTVARGWVLAGCPAEIIRSDSYATWDGSMRGLMDWAGGPAGFGQSDEASSKISNEDDAEWAEFLEALHDVFGTRPFTARQVLEHLPQQARVHGHDRTLLVENLPGDLADRYGRPGSDGGFVKSLGKWLGNRDGRYADGWTVHAARSGKHAVRYVVTPPEGGEDS
jgi:bifunctional DNA primase/polymerase-like protein